MEVDIENWPMGVHQSSKPSSKKREAIQVGGGFHSYQGELHVLLPDRDMEESVQNPEFFQGRFGFDVTIETSNGRPSKDTGFGFTIR